MAIRCSTCQYDNLDDSSYCQRCGSTLTRAVSLPAAVGQQNNYELRGQDGTIYPLSGMQTQIGRQAGCAILLPESSVSGRHAMLIPQGGQWFLQDLGSSNGTYINGVKLIPHQATPIQPGSQLKLGSWQGTFYGSAISGAYSPTIRVGGGISAPPVQPIPNPSKTTLAPRPRNQIVKPFAALAQAISNRFTARSGPPSLPSGAVAIGIVTNALPDEAMDVPRDASKTLLKLAFWILLLGGLILLGIANWIWLAIALLPVILLLWMMRLIGVFLMPFGMFSLFGSKKAQVQGATGPRGFHWSLTDTTTNLGVSGSLVRKPRQGGTLTAGDEVAVYGRINRNNLVEAHAIVVTKRAGNPIWIRIEGIRPWPIWIGLMAILSAAGALLGFAHTLHLF